MTGSEEKATLRYDVEKNKTGIAILEPECSQRFRARVGVAWRGERMTKPSDNSDMF